ncbi:MAG: T9SS type A sorting domain-containing protein [Flavobacterium sp.]|nr:T9SS type A sorting domain-containing protein [Flavobacterium sp.]
MKKTLFISALITQTLGFGQILNGNFEDIKPNFLVNHWGINFSVPVSINTETGESTSDNILYGNCIASLCNATTEAAEGNYGLEIANAFNTNQKTVIPGGAHLFWDSTQDSPGWNPGVPLVGNESIDFLSFHYKFLPFGADVAEVKLTILNQDGVEMGIAQLDLPPTDANFHFVSIPVIFTEPGSPVHLYLDFNLAKEGSTPTFGTRMVIDDVRTGSLLQSTTFSNQAFAVSPTLVQEEINIHWTTNTHTTQPFQIINQSGQICQSGELNSNQRTVNVSVLSSGIYFFKIENTTRKFVKVE